MKTLASQTSTFSHFPWIAPVQFFRNVNKTTLLTFDHLIGTYVPQIVSDFIIY